MIKELIKNIQRDLPGVDDLLTKNELINQTENLSGVLPIRKRTRFLKLTVGHPHPKFVSTIGHPQLISKIKLTGGIKTSLENYESNVELPCLEMVDEYEHVFPMQTSEANSLIEIILSFKTLHESWDGYGALPLEAKSASNAVYLITKLSDKVKSKISNVYPNSNGTISFEWENYVGERLVTEIGNGTMSYYLKLNSYTPKFMNDVSFDDESIFKMVSLVKKLFI